MRLPAPLIAELKRVPELPASASRLLQVVNDQRHGLADVIKVVRHDPVLTGRILKIANSAAYSLPNPVATVERAVPILGESMIIGITLAEAVAALHQRELAGYHAEAGALWAHDLRCAIAARRLAPLTVRKDAVEPDLAFTCGLLHDLGKSVLSAYVSGRDLSVLDHLEVSKDLADYLAAEQDLLGTDHTEVGLALARLWKLPEPLQVVMAGHHRPAAGPEQWRSLLYVVHLGDMVAMMAGVGTGADTLRYRLDPGYPQVVAVDADTLAGLMIQVEEEFHLLEKAFFDNGD